MALKEEKRLSQSGGSLKFELPDKQQLSTETRESSESHRDDGSSITLQDFRNLLDEEEFTDFFNKFICLPAFSQLVVYSRKRKQFVLYPPLPDYYTLNCNGLVEWLWENRLSFFLKSRFFGEYRLCTSLLRLSLVRKRDAALKTELARTVFRSLRWLKTKCLGRVAGIRQFREFMSKTSDGCKLYHYCLDFECLYFHVRRRSKYSAEVFDTIREKYFSGTSECKISQHFLDEVWEILSQTDGTQVTSGMYSVAFTVCLHKIFIRRMKNYWMPRFLLEQTPPVASKQEVQFLDVARRYLRGTIKLAPSDSTSEVLDNEQKDCQDSKKNEQCNDANDIEDLVEEDLSVEDEEELKDSETLTGNFDENSEQQESTADDVSNESQSRESRPKGVTFQEHPPPGVQNPEEADEENESTESEETEDETSSGASSEEEQEYQKRVERRRAFYQKKNATKTPHSSKSIFPKQRTREISNLEKEADSETHESHKSNSRRSTSITPESNSTYSRGRAASTPSESKSSRSWERAEITTAGSRRYADITPESTESVSGEQENAQGEYEASDSRTELGRRNSEEARKSGDSSAGSDSAESWEGVQDTNRKGNRGEKKFRFKNRHRERSIQKRKIKFEEFLTKESFRQSVSKADRAKLAARSKMSSNRQKTSPQENTEVKALVPNSKHVKNSYVGNTDLNRVKAALKPPAPGKKLRQMSKVSKTNFPDLQHNDEVDDPLKKKPSNSLVNSSTGANLNSRESNLARESMEDDSPQINKKKSQFSSLGSYKSSRSSFPQKTTKVQSQEAALRESVPSCASVQSSPKPKYRPLPKVKQKRRKLAKFTFSLSDAAPVPQPKRKETKKQETKPEKPRKPSHKIPKQRRKKKRIVLPSLPNAMMAVPSSEFTIGKDNAYRNRPENMRMILALQADQCASQPFRTFLVSTDNAELVHYLRFWQDVEKTRQDFQFGTMTFAWFMRSMNEIVKKYLLRSSPSRIEAPDRLRDETIMSCLSPKLREMPWQIRKLQKEAMEDLKHAHLLFCQRESDSFLDAATFKEDGARRFSVRTTGIFLPPISNSARSNSELNKSNAKFHSEMEFRMTRSLHYIIQINLPDGRESNSALDINDESDDDGCMPPFPPPTNVREIPIDYKELASRSAKQYPFADGAAFANANKNLLGPRNGFGAYCISQRKQAYMKRPLIRPKFFHEVLKDHVHFQFFKRFLKAHRADIPLTFWKAVENLRQSSKTKSKPYRVQHIATKYFFNSKMPATKLLQCKADIIKEIPYVSLVTASMLFSAQQIIARVLKERWFVPYANTFDEQIPPASTSEDNDKLYRPTERSQLSEKDRVRRAWRAFTDFVRKIATFQRAMRKPSLFYLFNNFLLSRMDEEEEQEFMQMDTTLPLELFDAHSETSSLPFNVTRNDEDKQEMKRSLINGHVIIRNFLSNDLHFWRDIECYKNVFHCFFMGENKRSRDFEEGEVALRAKANLILSCYLESDIKPKIRVNIPPEVSDITIESLQDGLIDRSLFHEATVYLLPLLLHFWSKFCAEHYRYVPTLSKRHKLIYGLKMTPMIANEIKRKRKQGPVNIVDDDYSKPGIQRRKKLNRIDTADLPNYLDLDKIKIGKEKGSPFGMSESMCPRLTFSLQKGVTLVQPVRRLTLPNAYGRSRNNISSSSTNSSVTASPPPLNVENNCPPDAVLSDVQYQEIEPIANATLPRSICRRPGILSPSVIQRFLASQKND